MAIDSDSDSGERARLEALARKRDWRNLKLLSAAGNRYSHDYFGDTSKFGPAMRARANAPAALLAMLAKVAALLPSHTRRSEESQALQQFSTPLALGLVASAAAAITPADLVLEPSAGTGLLAIFAELAGKAGEPERIMIDATHLKAHRTAASLLKGGLFPDVSGAPKAA